MVSEYLNLKHVFGQNQWDKGWGGLQKKKIQYFLWFRWNIHHALLTSDHYNLHQFKDKITLTGANVCKYIWD